MTTNTPARETQQTIAAWGCVAKEGDGHLYQFANGFGIYPDKSDAQYLCDQHANAYKVMRVHITVPGGQAKAGARGAGASQQFEGNNTGPESSAALQAQNEALVAALEKYETWLKDRIEWLTREAHGGGNWEHLNTRRCEAAHVLELFRAALAQAKAAKVQP